MITGEGLLFLGTQMPTHCRHGWG